MRRLAVLLLAGLLLAQGPALAQRQERTRTDRQAPPSRERDRRESLTRERSSPDERHREQRFTPAEREKLRQDLMDANRSMRGGRAK
jgi:hypothetical protein